MFKWFKFSKSSSKYLHRLAPILTGLWWPNRELYKIYDIYLLLLLTSYEWLSLIPSKLL